jgi:16S rRNA (uracil1498-N3)-methyltransferase
MPGFVVRPEDVGAETLVLRGGEAHHLIEVRRQRVGDQVEVIDGAGGFFAVAIEALETDRAVCRILQRWRERGESRVRLCLAPALVKGERFDYVVEKATEIGVDGFAPLVAARGVVRHGSEVRMERWRRLVQAAAKQCGRSRLPPVRPPAPLAAVLEWMNQDGRVVLMAAPGDGDGDLGALLRARRPDRLGLLIGPEGGFTSQEEEQTRAAGGALFSWGSRTLRADTAGIVLAALVLHEAEQCIQTDQEPDGPNQRG